VRSIVGAILIWAVTCPVAAADRPLAAGWIGMTGMAMALHFGMFDLLSLLWRRAGIGAEPLMNAPLRARSLSDFWSSRWNRSFSRLAHALVFVPLRRSVGPAAALMASFLASGLIHDAVISLPARAGFGLPTLYFAIQGGGVLLERRLRPRWRRPIALAVAILPVPLLFHAPFVRVVWLPFLRAIGAL
jgi:D-alanyl-lipoteichoic acid acyltransferase DltB (MBOAT superfamily)